MIQTVAIPPTFLSITICTVWNIPWPYHQPSYPSLSVQYDTNRGHTTHLLIHHYLNDTNRGHTTNLLIHHYLYSMEYTVAIPPAFLSITICTVWNIPWPCHQPSYPSLSVQYDTNRGHTTNLLIHHYLYSIEYTVAIPPTLSITICTVWNIPWPCHQPSYPSLSIQYRIYRGHTTNLLIHHYLYNMECTVALPPTFLSITICTVWNIPWPYHQPSYPSLSIQCGIYRGHITNLLIHHYLYSVEYTVAGHATSYLIHHYLYSMIQTVAIPPTFLSITICTV